jgi:hypothetical protein
MSTEFYIYNVPSGTSQVNRIGNSITPVSLRHFVNFELIINEDALVQNLTQVPFGAVIRFITLQFKGGNGTTAPGNQGYHGLCPLTPNKVLADWYPFMNPVNAGQDYVPSTLIGVSPFRKGITRECTILSDRKFYLNSQSKYLVQKKFKVKCPVPIVWNEDYQAREADDYSTLMYPSNVVGGLIICYFSRYMAPDQGPVQNVSTYNACCVSATFENILTYRDM